MSDAMTREVQSVRALEGQVTVVSTEQADTPEEQAKREKRRKFMIRARTDFQTVATAEATLREAQLEDLEFRASKQWNETVVQERLLEDRPVITVNRLPLFIRQITNAMRGSNLGIKVAPVDDGADIETAEVFQGVIRHLEYHSDAQVAYMTAGEHQATIGRGYWTIDAEFLSETSWDQTLRIKRVRNPFSVYMDPTTQEADGSDARFAFLVEDVPKNEYRDRFGQASLTSLEDFTGLNHEAPDWLPEGRIRIAKYWYVDMVKTTIHEVLWADGEKTSLEAEVWDQAPEEVRVFGRILRSREGMKRIVKCAIINGATIIEGNEDLTDGRLWPGKWIPVVQVLGEEIDLNGERDLRGVVRDAKSPQVLYNYQQTALAEALMTAPKAPWVGAEGQFEGHEQKWREANTKLFPYLEYVPVTLDGKDFAPPPRRESPVTNIAPIVTAIQLADQDLKSVIGLYEPSLGMRSAAESGKAINALKQAGEQATSNYTDNMARAIRFTGRILVDLIPKYLERPRILRILGSDEQERTVMVHAGAEPGELPAETPDGIDGIYDLSAGTYDIAVSVGPSHETKRQEAFAALTQLVQAYPATFPILGDLIVGNMDWAGAQAAAKRLKALVPPEARGEEDGQPEIPPEVRQQIQALMQQAEQTAAELAKAQQVIQTKQVETAGKAQIQAQADAAKERIEAMKIRARLIEAREKVEGNVALTALKGEIDRMLQVLEQRFKLVFADQERQADRADWREERLVDHAEALANRARDEVGAERNLARDVRRAYLMPKPEPKAKS